MSRAGSGADVIPVRAGANIYTVLAGIAVIIQILALLVMFMKYSNAFEGYPFTTG